MEFLCNFRKYRDVYPLGKVYYKKEKVIILIIEYILIER